MAAAAPNPNNNLILLAVIGIGAYWLMSRRGAMAATPAGYYGGSNANTQAQAMENAARLNLINTGVRSVGGLLNGIFGGGGGRQNPIVWDGITNDGYAVNPAGATSAWDWWTRNGTGGD